MMEQQDFFTRNRNTIFKELLLNKFELLSDCNNDLYLSIIDYIFERPQKYYDVNSCNLYFNYLEWLYISHNDIFIQSWQASYSKINQALKNVYDINRKLINENRLGKGYLDQIWAINSIINFNYVHLLESVLHGLIYIIIYSQRLAQKKGVENMDLFNCIEGLKKTQFNYIKSECYNNIIRNSIAHGSTTYSDNQIVFQDRTNSFAISPSDLVSFYDRTLDICNGMILAIKIFISRNYQSLVKQHLDIPFHFALQELAAQVNSSSFEVKDCVETSTTIDNLTQINIFCNNALTDYSFLNLKCFDTAVVAESLLPNYGRYFISLNSYKKKITAGWAAYDGKILKKCREKNTNNILAYAGVSDGIYEFNAKERIKILRMISFYWRYVFQTIHLHKVKSRFSQNIGYKSFDVQNRKTGLVIDARFYYDKVTPQAIVEHIRNSYKIIINNAITKARQNSKKILVKINKLEYIRVLVYDAELRERTLQNGGLTVNLICAIYLNKSKSIKNYLILGKRESYGEYIIVWNTHWNHFNLLDDI